MRFYKGTKAMLRDGNTDFFNIVTGVLQGDTLAPFLFIISLDYVLQISIDLKKEKGFHSKKKRDKKHYIPQKLLQMRTTQMI